MTKKLKCKHFIYHLLIVIIMESHIESLPYDILNCIFKFVTNKIPLNRTCILFNQQLKKLYDNKQLVNHNDPYFLSRYYNAENILEITKHANKITDSKNLNYVCMLIDKDYTVGFKTHIQLVEKLVKQYCVIDNPNIEGFCVLMGYLKDWGKMGEDCIIIHFIILITFKTAIIKKSYKVAFKMMYYFEFLGKIWLNNACQRMSNKDEWNNILNEIKYVPREIVPFNSILWSLIGGKHWNSDCELARYLNSYLDSFGFRKF